MAETAPTTPDSRIRQWKSEIQASKNKKKSDYIDKWQTNIDYRRGQPQKTVSNAERIPLPLDWSSTKAKLATLWSMMPEVRLLPRFAEFAAAVPVFGKELNDTLDDADVFTTVASVVVDCINAAGIGAVIIGYESRQRQKALPKFNAEGMPPEIVAALMKDPKNVDLIPEVSDYRLTCTRVSPGDLLWPAGFKLDNMSKHAPWLGREGKMRWADAKHAFGLTDAQKAQVCGQSNENASDKLNPVDGQDSVEHDIVEYEEIFYWAHIEDPNEPYFDKINHLVFVKGIEKPVIDGPWKGQEFNEQTKTYVGACLLPLRVLTLTYISDEAVPPSDSEIKRPLMNELQKSRHHMALQREHSRPLRWYDPNRVDKSTITRIQKGGWQELVPTKGNGSAALGEIARASYPTENDVHDRIMKTDMQEVDGVGINQAGSMASGERSATEAGIVQTNYQTRQGFERDRVAKFFVGIVEVFAGLLALYGKFEVPYVTPEEQQRMAQWDRKTLSHKFLYSIRPDSTVRIEASSRKAEIKDLITNFAKSGRLNLDVILPEYLALLGFDPATAIAKPQPAPPPPVNISVRSWEDLNDPMFVAMLMKTQQGPGPEHVSAAMELLKTVPQRPVVVKAGDVPPISGGQPVNASNPQDLLAPTVQPGDAEPDWHLLDRVNQRVGNKVE